MCALRLSRQEEQRRALELAAAALADLPEREREAIQLHVLREPPLPLREIAVQQGVTICTVHERIEAGLREVGAAVRRSRIGDHPARPYYRWGMRDDTAASGRSWAELFSREILGLIFFMAGFYKVFEMGALAHARNLFVQPYADSILSAWSLWLTGTTIPFVELIAGGLLIIGWRTRDALVALGVVLVIVTFGHLLAEPLYAFDRHVIPRWALLVVCLLLRDDARWSLDGLRAGYRLRNSRGSAGQTE